VNSASEKNPVEVDLARTAVTSLPGRLDGKALLTFYSSFSVPYLKMEAYSIERQHFCDI
jgi:hypothetical protein